ncbi:glycosyltransferase family 2 protein [Tamlana sp. 2_MG-2023]|uniref:glycosyltransferase family 2 protein n=1 Tax=unclassified Tamlana TaxID=2614803 RepID=UPI0026E1F4CC|nr:MULTISPECIES: glycosyltransferase family 2 protein [unclassified Tamlana]MDO6760256.1 glycosyltransferase family 2 protein [Tamlana sp. 2_MG-2023]MDO6790046.1 glycosyltransferase family 2 protein [Tamlana sp. 1_MG-2023]
MKVSIITATYNSADVIEHCMQSVLNQDYPNIEYIIIDGQSKDHTLNIVVEYQKKYPNIKVISEPDSGIYDALNKGIQKATGDVIGFVHSDDFLANSSVISNIVKAFKSQNCDGVYGDLEYVDQQNTNKVIRYWKSCDFDQKLLKKGWMPAHPTLFLKSDIYKKHGIFDLDFKIAADYDFILRVFKNPELRFVYIPEVITKMRVGGASNRSLKNIISKSKEDYKALHKNNIGSWNALIIKNVSKLSQFYKK